MSKLIELLFGSILITVSTIALIFFSTLHYILKAGGISGCAWHGSAIAWIDSNHNGLLNHGEPPLSNVAIHIDDMQNDLVDVGWPAITDKNGNAQLIVSNPNCSKRMFEIYADFPKGFRVTTSPRLEVTRDFSGSLSSGNTYYFGFSSDK